MNTEEKAKRYDEALEMCRKLHNEAKANEYTSDMEDYEAIFPELKESEDEKIRQEIIDFIFDKTDTYELREKSNSWLAWLEKQGEQKSNKEFTFKALPRLLDMIEPTDKAKAYCQKLIDSLENEGYTVDTKIVGECLKGMNGEKVAMATMDEQKPTWSEEDETMITDLSVIVHTYFSEISGIPFKYDLSEDKIRTWLKSLRPQKQQEWDKHDIEMIEWLIRCCEKEHEELCNDKYGHQDIVSDLKRDCRKKWDWLESLKDKVAPQKQWKPTEEQIKALTDTLSLAKSCGDEGAFDLGELLE